MRSLSVEQGVKVVRLARRAVEVFFEESKILEEGADEPFLTERRGVFVTINEYPTHGLRGCIGFPYPTLPLYEAVIQASLSAAFNDPRFPPLGRDELDRVIFEVSILTVPEEIKYNKPTELPSLIKVGEDGLIIESEHGSGLLLPQVAVEEGWDAEEFLTGLCIKAGLRPTYWLEGKAKILRFRAQIFTETSPRGEVIEVKRGKPTC